MAYSFEAQHFSSNFLVDAQRPPNYNLALPNGSPAGPSHTSISHGQPTLFEGRWCLDPQRQREICTLLNARAPINKLPVEMLSEIMLTVQAHYTQDVEDDIEDEVITYPEERPEIDWLRVLLVCRHWFDVGAGTPRLWRLVILGQSGNYFRTALARSKALTVTLEIRDLHDNYDRQALETLNPRDLDRIRHLSYVTCRASGLRSPSSRSPLDILLPHKMVELQSVKYYDTTRRGNWGSRRSSIDLPAIQFDRERLPNLRALSLAGINSNLLPSSLLAQFSVLRLDGSVGLFPVMTLRAWTVLLHACVNIQQLILISLLPTSDDDDAPPATVPRRAVPRLKYLHVDDIPDMVKHVLSIFDIPSTAEVSLHWNGDDWGKAQNIIWDVAEKGFLAAMPEDRTGLPVLSKVTHVGLNDPARTLWAAWGPEDHVSSLSICLENDTFLQPRAHPLLVDALDLMRDAPLEELHIEVAQDRVPEVDWRAAFARFPRLRSLIVVVRRGESDFGGRAICEALDPRLAPEGTPEEERLLLPELEMLEMENFGVSESLVVPPLRKALEGHAFLRESRRGLGKLELHWSAKDGSEDMVEAL